MCGTFTYDAVLGAKPPPVALDFRKTQFFRHSSGDASPQLPEPASVLAAANNKSRGLIVYEEQDLVVKYGRRHHVRIEEAQAMQAIRQAFPNNEIPVPELFGWRMFGELNFLYMELIPGVTLENAWPTLNDVEKSFIAAQLEHMITLLRKLRQQPSMKFIGSISRSRIQDIFFCEDSSAGPFADVKSFNDHFKNHAIGRLPNPFDPFRALLPDTSNICFSHADLALDNIMISGQAGSRSVVAILDWGMSGWYPEYWEFCKMLFRVGDEEFYYDGWLPKVLIPYHDEYEAFTHYWGCRVP